MNSYETKQQHSLSISSQCLKQLSLLQKNSYNRLQLISYHYLTAIKSLNDEYSILRIVIYSVFCKTISLKEDNREQIHKKLQDIIKSIDWSQIVNNIGISQRQLIQVGLYGLSELFEKQYVDNQDNQIMKKQKHIIHVFNCIPFFDKILMKAIQQNLNIKDSMCDIIGEYSSTKLMEIKIIKFIKQFFNLNVTFFDSRQFENSDKNRLIKTLRQKQDEIKIIYEIRQRKTISNDDKNDQNLFEYIKISEKQIVIQRFCSPILYNKHISLTNQQVNQFNTAEDKQVSYNYLMHKSLPNSVQKKQKNQQEISIPQFVHQQRITQTPIQIRSINQQAQYLQQTIQDSFTASMDLGSPACPYKRNLNKMKQNINNQNLSFSKNRKTLKYNEKDSRKNSDVIPFQFPSEQNLQAMINDYNPSQKSRIIRRKKKEKRNGGIWSLLCCQGD